MIFPYSMTSTLVIERPQAQAIRGHREAAGRVAASLRFSQ